MKIDLRVIADIVDGVARSFLTCIVTLQVDLKAQVGRLDKHNH